MYMNYWISGWEYDHEFFAAFSEVDLSTTILGEKVTLPIGIAPTATQKLAHPDGEQATAKGNTSMQATYSLAGGPLNISLGCWNVKPSFLGGGAGIHQSFVQGAWRTQHRMERSLTCIVRATYRLVRYLLAHHWLICKLHWFPELIVSRLSEKNDNVLKV